MTSLVSPNNPRIKQIRVLLAQRKAREEKGLFVVEGIHHVGEAIEAKAEVEYLCYAPDLLISEYALHLIQEQEHNGTPCLAVDGDTFTSIAGKDNPQGVLAVAHQAHSKLSDLTPQSFPWGVACVAPQDPGNIGTILRTIDAVGASGLLLLDDPTNSQYCADPYHPSAVRASMGAIFWYPLVHAQFSEFVAWSKEQHYSIYGTSAHARQDYREIGRFTQPLILLMGSEREGLTPSQS
ncbi:MAG TPA: RNA methyltransferase, partial [Anaerolineales bacterium]|nr:RNA methyltransferase [Anaerolineales bacterium]